MIKNYGKQTKKLNFYSNICHHKKNQFKSDWPTVKAVNRLYPGHVSRMIHKSRRISEFTGNDVDPIDEESCDLNSHKTNLNATECESLSI